MRARVEVLATRASNQLRAKQRRLGRLRSADELAAHAADWRFLRTSPPAAHRLVTDGPAGRSARHLLRRVEAWTPGAPRRSVGAWGGGCPRRGMGAWGMRPTRYGRLGSERRVGALAIRAPCRGARDARRTSSERSNGAWGVCACRGASAWAARRTAVSETFQTLGQVACHPKPPYVPKNERFGNRGDSQASDFGTSWSESACFPRSTGGALAILSRYGLPNRSIIGRKSAFRQQAPLPTAGRETPLRCASLQRKGTTGETARAGRAPGTRRARCESARTGAADARQTALPHTMGREGYKNTPPKAMGRGARFPRRVKPRALAARRATSEEPLRSPGNR